MLTTYFQITTAVKHINSDRHVTVLMRKLKKSGFLSTVTGVCTPAEVNAIKKFQTANSLISDGIFGSKSWTRLVELL